MENSLPRIRLPLVYPAYRPQLSHLLSIDSMTHTPSHCVLLDFTSQPSPCPRPPSEGEYTRNSVYVYDDEGPYSDPAVYESM